METTPAFRPPTLSESVTHWASTRPDAAALRCGQQVLTWAELDAATTRAGAALAGLGVRDTDRVALLGENTLAWVVSFLGCQRAGMVAVPMNTRLAPSQVLQQVAKVDARVVLHDSGWELPEEAADGPARWVTFEDLADHCVGPAAVASPGPPERPAIISFTSGTTGVPKGAVVSASAIARLGASFSEYFGTGPGDSTLVLVPIFHNTGFADQLSHMLVSGGCTNLVRRYRTDAAAAELITHPATFLAAVPSMVRMLMLHPDADAVFAGIHTIMYGGSAMPGAWVQELLDRWPHLDLVHAYGLSEFTSVCTFLPSDLAPTRAESVGRALPGVALRIADADGAEAEPGTWGEVWVGGPTRMLGYWDEPALSADKMPGPWLRTGDVGRLDEEGLLWLRGRLDDAINRGGEKIMPTFVESHLARHDAIAAACVFGYPDPILHERVGAAIQLRPASTVDVAELREALHGCLPDYAVPDQWVIYDALPLNASGKFDRATIRSDFTTSRSASTPPNSQGT